MLSGESAIVGNKRANTLYLTIPANIAKDSAFELKEGDSVSLQYDPKRKELVVKKK
jgi:hypothetical protein